MWICPVCGTKLNDEIYVCPVCGFDERKNFHKYPSLIPLDASAIETVEAMWRKASGYNASVKAETDPHLGEPLDREETADRGETTDYGEDHWSEASFSGKTSSDNTVKITPRMKGTLLSDKPAEPAKKSALKMTFDQ